MLHFLLSYGQKRTHTFRFHFFPPVNTIGRVQMEVQHELPVEPFSSNRISGALIVVDPASHRTSGALLVDLAPTPARDAW